MTKNTPRPTRRQFQARLRIAVSGQDEIVERYATNISSGGAFIHHQRPAPIGTLLVLEFTLPNNQPLCRIAAKVAHFKAPQTPNDREAGMGLRFIAFDDASKALIKRLTTQLAQQTAPPRPTATEPLPTASEPPPASELPARHVLGSLARAEPSVREALPTQPSPTPTLYPNPDTASFQAQVPTPNEKQLDERPVTNQLVTPGETVVAPQDPTGGPIVGIDFGTTLSCIAIYENDKPRILTSPEGYDAIPSVVAFESNSENVYVGHRAAERMTLDPSRSIFWSKRLLGTSFATQEIARIAERVPYHLIADNTGQTAIKVDDKVIRPEEVVAHILGALRHTAERVLGVPVHRAIFAVPTYFDAPQRQALREACRIADIKMERIIDETVATALAYTHACKKKGTIVVCDLGGASFNVSVVSLRRGVCDIVANDTDRQLGGSDFDNRLTDYLLDTFQRTHGVDIRTDSAEAVMRLRFAAQMAKEQLSQVSETLVDVPFVATVGDDLVDLQIVVTRDVFEHVTHDLIERIIGLINEVLATAKKKFSDIDDVLLVGGQTHSHPIRQAVESLFGRVLFAEVQPDDAVAIGAALATKIVERTAKTPVAKTLHLSNILPVSIRLELEDGSTEILLARGTKLPVETEFKVLTRDTPDAEVAHQPWFAKVMPPPRTVPLAF
ncbi:MAG: Hsp70 family protein [Myxococcota bacterium]